jgi:hypothetical protein
MGLIQWKSTDSGFRVLSLGGESTGMGTKLVVVVAGMKEDCRTAQPGHRNSSAGKDSIRAREGISIDARRGLLLVCRRMD